MSKKILSLEIPEDTLVRLKDIASIQEMSVSGLVRLIIKKYFNDLNESSDTSSSSISKIS